MKIQIVALILAALIFLTEGANVSRPLNEGGNVYHVNNYIGGVQPKVILSFMKILDNKLDQIIKNTGVSSTGNTTIACLKGLTCDQTTTGGGWTVFQRRQDGAVDFYRGWNDYKTGFGDLKGEFWLGLDKINRLTHQTRNRLRVELEDTAGKSAYAEYDYFAVASERSKYKLSLGTYSGTAGDSLSTHRAMAFTTKDRDNDVHNTVNCAVEHKGAWWYQSCHHSNLNGLYHHGKHSSYADGVNWHHWKGYNYSVKRAEMKIRPAA